MLFLRVRNKLANLSAVFSDTFLYIVHPSGIFFLCPLLWQEFISPVKADDGESKERRQVKTQPWDCCSILTAVTVHSGRQDFNRIFCLGFVIISYSFPMFSQNSAFHITGTAAKKSQFCANPFPQILNCCHQPLNQQ